MNDYKLGDKVWILVEEHEWGSYPCMINNFNIRSEEISEVHNDCLYVHNVDGYFFLPEAYKSKNEVINALIKKLEVMKDE